MVVDRAWNLVDANASVAVLLGQADPELLAPRAGRAVRRAPGLSRRPPPTGGRGPGPGDVVVPLRLRHHDRVAFQAAM